MRVSGFTLVRNGTLFDYPFLQSFRSLLPLVDDFVINVGIGDDDTLDYVRSFTEEEGKGKVTFFESNWQIDQPEYQKGGIILSQQTNLALDRCQGDWCFYLQADEVIHEEDIPVIRRALTTYFPCLEVEGLLFDYIHFYGSYNVVQYSRSVYRKEVRVVRRSVGARSIGDAQSFRKKEGSKLFVAPSGGHIFHYGWVRNPEAMREKTFFLDQLYHGVPSAQQSKDRVPHTGDHYRYKKILGLKSFQGKHPRIMEERIKQKNWYWDLEHSPLVWTWRDIKKIILDWFEKKTGYRLFEYRSYRFIRRNYHHVSKIP